MSPVDTPTYVPALHAVVASDASLVASDPMWRREYASARLGTMTFEEAELTRDDVSGAFLVSVASEDLLEEQAVFAVREEATEADRAVNERDQLLARRYAGIELNREQDLRLQMLKLKILELIPFATPEDYEALASHLEVASAMDAELEDIRADVARITSPTASRRGLRRLQHRGEMHR